MMMKYFLLLLLLPMSCFAQLTEVDSLFAQYKPKLESYSEVNPEIGRLESVRQQINENLGLIILEEDAAKRRTLIIKNTRKDMHHELLKMSTDQIEKVRNETDSAIKAKIALLCLEIRLQGIQAEQLELKKSKINYLLDRGFNLSDFSKLSEERQLEILKDW